MSFDRLAPHYRWMEWVLAGRKLQRCRMAFLPEIDHARATLLVGEGNGRFLSELLKKPFQGPISYVDSSVRMLECARARLRGQGLSTHGITFIHANILEWSPPGDSFDLIVTHFFLDCFQQGQLESIVSRLAGAAKPGAKWLLADFQLPDAGWQKVRAGWILALMFVSAIASMTSMIGLLALLSGVWIEETQAANQPITFYVQLIRGSDKHEAVERDWKPIGFTLKKKLRPVFRWTNYWEVSRNVVAVEQGKIARVQVNRQRAVEIELLGDNQRDVRLYQNGELRRRTVGSLSSKMAVLGGDREGDESWFVVVRRDRPSD